MINKQDNKNMLYLLGCNLLRSFPDVIETETKKKADCSRFTGGRLNKQGKLQACRGWQDKQFSVPACLILRGFIKALTRFSHAPKELYLGPVMYSVQIVSTLHFYLEAVSLEELLEAGKQTAHIPKHKGVDEDLPVAWVQLEAPTSGHVFFLIFLNI